jgi:hypothetical protein
MTENPMSLAEIARPFARGFIAKRPLADDPRLSKTQKARVKESLSDDLKKLCDVLIPTLRVPEVSVAAQRRADELGVDLCQQTWHGQKAFDPLGRGTFHLEHVVPIVALREAWMTATTVEEMISEIDHRLRVAWILKTEDVLLRRAGYQKNRPDPDAAYAQVGISLVTCHPAGHGW